jgi:tRNA wybutosine-synthesizing protein 3
LTASTNIAQHVVTAALSAGFRESGAVSLSAAKSGEYNPMVAVRSAGYSFDSIIGYRDEHGRNVPLVDERYLRTLLAIANDRFRINVDRISRFQIALMEAFNPSSSSGGNAKKPEWEDAEIRKQRKREEGLARQQALRTHITQPNDATCEGRENYDTLDEIYE